MKRHFALLTFLALLFPAVTSAASCPLITVRLSNGTSHTQVIALKKFLVLEGVMAPTSNTTFFGPLTQAALQKWQCKKGIVCSGTPASTGYGATGPITRTALKNCSATTTKPPTEIIKPIGIPPEQTPPLSGGGGGSGSGTVSPSPVTYSWSTGAWSACVNNSQSRTVSCVSSHNQNVADSFCGSAKPASVQSCSSSAPTPLSCSFPSTGSGQVTQTIAHGASVTAYQSASVAYGSQCVSESRICSNGTLSGTYTYSSCAVQSNPTGQSCTFAGQTIALGGTVVAYKSSSVYYGQLCESQVRTCTNGSLNGAYTNASCTISEKPVSTLSAGKTTLNTGESTTISWTSTHPGGCNVYNDLDVLIGSGNSGSLNSGAMYSSQTIKLHCYKIPGDAASVDVVKLFIGAGSTDTFLVAGQSNAKGTGNKDLSPVPGNEQAWQYYDKPYVTPAVDPVGNAYTGSAWPAFAIEYYKQTGRVPVFVPTAVGSTGAIKESDNGYGNWGTSGTLLTDSVNKLKEEQAYFNAQQRPSIIKGILWSQGENDANYINAGGETKEMYRQGLKSIIAEYRKKLGFDVPFYIFRTGKYPIVSDVGWQQVRDAQEEVAKEVDGVYIVYRGAVDFPARGFMNPDDHIHYTQPGLNEMGTMGAQEVVKSFSNSNTNTSARALTSADMFKNWPQPPAGRAYLVSFVDGGGKGNGRLNKYLREDSGNYKLEEYWVTNGVPALASIWHYKMSPETGVLEYADTVCDISKGPSSCQKGDYAPGYEIKWGARQPVGSSVSGKMVLQGENAPFGYNTYTVSNVYSTLKIWNTNFSEVAKIDLSQQICRQPGFVAGSIDHGPAASKDQPGLVSCPYYELYNTTYYFVPYWGFMQMDSYVDRYSLSGKTSQQPMYREPAYQWCDVAASAMSCP